MSSEFILSLVVFVFILATVMFMWATTTLKINEAELLFSMDEASTDALEKLVRTSGYPEDWETLSDLDEIHSVGLATESRVLDKSKVLRFIQLMDSSAYNNLCRDATISNYECSRHLLALGRYDFYVNVSYFNGQKIGESGRKPTNVDYVLKKRRNALLDDEIVSIELVVWY